MSGNTALSRLHSLPVYFTYGPSPFYLLNCSFSKVLTNHLREIRVWERFARGVHRQLAASASAGRPARRSGLSLPAPLPAGQFPLPAVSSSGSFLFRQFPLPAVSSSASFLFRQFPLPPVSSSASFLFRQFPLPHCSAPSRPPVVFSNKRTERRPRSRAWL